MALPYPIQCQFSGNRERHSANLLCIRANHEGPSLELFEWDVLDIEQGSIRMMLILERMGSE